MKWFATLKWELISDIRSVRWVILGALALLGLLMLLSLPVFGISGGIILWGVYMLAALGGAYLVVIYPILASMYLLKFGLAERLSGRPFGTAILVRMPLNAVIVATGLGLLYLASIAHQRLELTQFELLYLLLTMGNTPMESQIGRIIEMWVGFSIVTPPLILLLLTSFHIVSKRITLIVRLAFFVPLLILAAINGFHVVLLAVVYGQPLTWLIPLAASFVCVAVTGWLYDAKCDYYEVK